MHVKVLCKLYNTRQAGIALSDFVWQQVEVGRQGFPGDVVVKESAWHSRRCNRHGFHSWVQGKSPQRRKWQPTPVFLPGTVHGQRILVGYSPWSHKESDTTEATEHAHAHVRGKVAQHHVSYNVSDGNQWKGARAKLLKLCLTFFLLSYVLPSAKCPSLS